MKIVFVVNNIDDAYNEYMYTNLMPTVKRRVVEIELTEEQVEQIGIRLMGVDKGIEIYERVESVSLKLEKNEKLTRYSEED